MSRQLAVVIALVFLAGRTDSLFAGDWPQWRHDAARSAASVENLSGPLKPQWTRAFEPRKQAWDDPLNLDLMTYDKVFEPIVAQGRLFLAFNDRDRLVAYDLATGKELWTFYCDGPVRLPPVAWRDRVYCASDDGFLYCLNAADGALVWKFRGGPNARQILGNQRMVSAWPMRGGPVVRDHTIHFAASIWPFMGTFIYALDTATGDVRWVNDETGAQYIKQPHAAPSFAGVAPQGALVATDTTLIVPGGRSVPAVFDRHTGKFKYFELASGGKGVGGSFVAANDESWFVHTRLRGTREFAMANGEKKTFEVNEPVLAGEVIYSAVMEKDQPGIRAWKASDKTPLWTVSADGRGDLILAGHHLAAAGARKANGSSTVSLISLPAHGKEAAVEWSTEVPGTVERLVVADRRLIAVTLEGRIHVFGHGPESSAVIEEHGMALAIEPSAASEAVALLKSGSAEGFAIYLGNATSPTALALVKASPFVELAMIDEDMKRVDAARRQLDAAGLYGRVSVRATGYEEFLPPPYVANMVFVDAEATARLVAAPAQIEKFYETVRPYGGVMCLQAAPDLANRVIDQLKSLDLPKAEVEAASFGVVVRRVGQLPGAGTWTHQYGDVANTIKSEDQRVKLPLGVLWFGGVSHNDVLPRHGHGPPEQVIGGRLIIQGTNSLTARDVYTGRVLWQRQFDNLGTYDVYFDDTYKETPLDPAYNQIHIPGANGRGTNYVATEDLVYLVEGSKCHLLDIATGKTVSEIALPQDDPLAPVDWGYIGVVDDVLLAGNGFAKYRQRLGLPDDPTLAPKKTVFGPKSLDRAASMGLVAFDRHTGKVLWKADAKFSFWHNGIVAGKGLVYTLDRHPKPVEEFLQRRGRQESDQYRLAAFDVRTGALVWERVGEVFGTWLGYSSRHDALLQAGAAASDRLSSEVGQGMAVYRGATGETVWKKDLKYSGPCVLHNDLIITNANSYAESAGALSIETGGEDLTPHPLTGEMLPWRITRAYGCNSIIASENLLTFRSGAAGFYDLRAEAGTGNLGGFRSGCTSNLVVADGVLNAPDYTRTCSCSYQNQTSLALVHMPEMDAWTISNIARLPVNEKARHVGLNLGAPGDRRDQYGLMWLAYPAPLEGGPDLGIELTGTPKWYQDHPSARQDALIPWVASSGVEGLTSLTMQLTPRFNAPAKPEKRKKDDDCTEADSIALSPAPEPYRLRLHFGVPRDSVQQARVFDVRVNGRLVRERLELGGNAPTSVVETVEVIRLLDELKVEFIPHSGSAVLSGLELRKVE